ncbi:helix-turn-helix domain-containing protein [Seohaeicola zhoushanensis]|uniref:Transcriptional regulator n=1 Tax=Seohaeicola zhoushanensis TaxID=1569283 RepID=A0A8J3H3Y9_9RHOB|nr:helix-turn-helix transcriptional regulator [Seohaeicola zhoushanensis]GHF76001.1 transcriptional regulator [Seohaeicola zhoushanensis]
MAGAVRTQAYQNLLTELVSYRQKAGLSQAALAKKLGKPPSYVGKYELGERRLDVVELCMILQVLNIDVARVLGTVLENVSPRSNS